MKVIDVIKKKQDKEDGCFKFYIINDEFCSKDFLINWFYKDGKITCENHLEFYDFLKDEVYSIYDEIRIIEEDKEIEIFNVGEEYKEDFSLYNATENECKLHRICCNLANKTNELVKAVNELKKGK